MKRSTAPNRPPTWTIHEKLRVVIEAAAQTPESLPIFLSAEGLTPTDLAQFREDGRATISDKRRPRA